MRPFYCNRVEFSFLGGPWSLMIARKALRDSVYGRRVRRSALRCLDAADPAGELALPAGTAVAYGLG
jgi:hypothetical protein